MAFSFYKLIFVAYNFYKTSTVFSVCKADSKIMPNSFIIYKMFFVPLNL